MIPNGDTKPVLPPGQPTRDLFNRQVAAQRAGIAQRKQAIRRWTRMGENVKDEEHLLSVAEKRLHRLLLRRQKTFTILAREAAGGSRRIPNLAG
jgi:uncharacterized membrane protein YcjF (UPF0283 family)